MEKDWRDVPFKPENKATTNLPSEKIRKGFFGKGVELNVIYS
jgi:hypothetical protein